VRALVEGFTGGYAFVTDPCWELLAWNRSFGSTFGLGGRDRGYEHNGLWIMFTDPASRRRFPDWDGIARRMVAMLRVEFAAYTESERFAALIEALSLRSAEFRAMWSHVEVFSPARWTVGELRDPASGTVEHFSTVRLPVPDTPGQTLVFYVPERSAVGSSA
jgi:hypothetical protein